MSEKGTHKFLMRTLVLAYDSISTAMQCFSFGRCTLNQIDIKYYKAKDSYNPQGNIEISVARTHPDNKRSSEE